MTSLHHNDTFWVRIEYCRRPGVTRCRECWFPPIAECIQRKYWVGEKGFGLFWVQLGIDFFLFFFFSRAVCNHGAVLFPMIASPLAKCTHTPTHTHTHTRARGKAVWKCDFTTSTKYSEERSEWRDIRHSSPGDITIFCAAACPFF